MRNRKRSGEKRLTGSGSELGNGKIERERDCKIEIERYRREQRGGRNKKYKRNKKKTETR